MFNKNMVITIVMAHLISGGIALITVTRQAKTTKRNQIIMTLIAVIVSQLQTIYLSYKIGRSDHA